MPDIVSNIVDRHEWAKSVTVADFARLSPTRFTPGTYITISDLKNAQFYSDGSNWRPVGGRQTIYKRSGTTAVPLATMTGNGSPQQFVIPDTLLIPAGLIAPHGSVYIEAYVKRTGTAAGTTCVASLGTVNNIATANDGSFVAQTIAATDGNEYRMFGNAHFSTATTTYTSTGSILPNQSTNANQSNRAANINTAASMWVNIGCSNTSFIAPDTLLLSNYHVWIEG